MGKTLMNKACACFVTFVLAIGLLPALQPQQAFAATTIKQVGLTIDYSNIPINVAFSSDDVNSALRSNVSLTSASAQVCSITSSECWLVVKSGQTSSGVFQFAKQNGSSKLTTGNDYYLMICLAQGADYAFPGDYGSSPGNVPLSVMINGSTRSDVHVDWYTSTSVRVFVPVKVGTGTLVTNISFNPSAINMQQGGNRVLKPIITGTQNARLIWEIYGAYESSTWVGNAGEVNIDAAEPVGTVLTIVAKSYDYPNVKGSCTVTVIAEKPSISSVYVYPQIENVDLTVGRHKEYEVDVFVEGTADHDWTVALNGQKSAETRIISQSQSGYTVYISGTESAETVRAVVTCTADPTKQALTLFNITPADRISHVDIGYNKSVLFKDTTKTCREMYTLVDSNIWNERTDSKLKLNGCYLTKRVLKDGQYVFAQSYEDSLLAAEGDYYIKVRVGDSYGDAAAHYWPDNSNDLSITVNGMPFGQEHGNGYVDWQYLRPNGGVVDLYIPLKDANAKEYWMQEYAPGVTAVWLKGDAPDLSAKQFTAPLFDGSRMMYVPDVKLWCTLTTGTPVLTDSKFASYETVPYGTALERIFNGLNILSTSPGTFARALQAM